MNSKLFAITIALLLLVAQPLSLLAQNSAPQTGWAAVQAVPSGTKLQIVTKDGKRITGKLSAATDAAITLSVNNAAANINRDDVQSIYRLSGLARAASTAIGAAAGAGAGAGIAAGALAATNGSDGATGILATGVLIGAAVGAGLGAAFGKSRRVLIYESK